MRKDSIWEWPIYDIEGNKHPKLTAGLTDNRSNPHGAIDIGTQGRDGFTVHAAYDGVVSYIGSTSGGGNTIRLEHYINGKTYESRYMHLKNYDALSQIIDDFIESKKSDESFKKAFEEKHNCDFEDFTYIGKSKLYDYFRIEIKSGSIIGIAGKTGGDYPIHLDFQISIKSGEERSIDPISFSQSYEIEYNNGKPYYKNLKIGQNYDMFMNIPQDLERSCKGPCEDCKRDFYDIVKKYNKSSNMKNTYEDNK